MGNTDDLAELLKLAAEHQQVENHKIYENPAGVRELEDFLGRAVASKTRPSS